MAYCFLLLALAACTAAIPPDESTVTENKNTLFQSLTPKEYYVDGTGVIHGRTNRTDSLFQVSKGMMLILARRKCPSKPFHMLVTSLER